MAFSTLQINDGTNTGRTFAFYQDGSGNYYSAPVITDAAGHILFVSANPGVISFSAPQHVIVDSATLGTVAVSGTFWQTTQPVSLASLPSLAAGSALVGQIEVSDGTNVLLTN